MSSSDPKERVSAIKAIAEAFQMLTVDGPNDLIAAYVMQQHGLHVTDRLIDSVRHTVSNPDNSVSD